MLTSLILSMVTVGYLHGLEGIWIEEEKANDGFRSARTRRTERERDGDARMQSKKETEARCLVEWASGCWRQAALAAVLAALETRQAALWLARPAACEASQRRWSAGLAWDRPVSTGNRPKQQKGSRPARDRSSTPKFTAWYSLG